MRVGIDIISRPVADIQLFAHRHQFLGGLARLNEPTMAHVLRVDNPKTRANQIADISLVGSHKVHLARRIKISKLERFGLVTLQGVGIHLIYKITVIDHDIQLSVYQSHAFSHIADGSIIGLVKQVVGHRVGHWVIE